MESKIKLALPSTTESGDIDKGLDLNELIVRHPAATYYVKVTSGCFEEMKISKGDILVVDRALDAYDGRMIVATLDGEFIVRKAKIEKDGRLSLVSHLDTNSLEITQEMDFTIFGVVTYIIHKCIS